MNAYEEKIKNSIKEFDLISLLRVLEYGGYKNSDITFASRFSFVSQISIIHDIKFVSKPTKRAEIIMNLGLLGIQGPMPDYFSLQLEKSGIERKAFHEFMGYFEHPIISSFVKSLYPEINTDLIPDWDLEKRRLLLLLDHKSASSLHWLFEKVFPELFVKVKKIQQQRSIRAKSLQLGSLKLGGDAVFGKKSSVSMPGQRVTLSCETDSSPQNRPWPQVIKERLDALVYPVLKWIGVDLEIVLEILNQHTSAKLTGESYLGYNGLQGGKHTTRKIYLFKGHLIHQEKTKH